MAQRSGPLKNKIRRSAHVFLKKYVIIKAILYIPFVYVWALKWVFRKIKTLFLKFFKWTQTHSTYQLAIRKVKLFKAEAYKLITIRLHQLKNTHYTRAILNSSYIKLKHWLTIFKSSNLNIKISYPKKQKPSLSPLVKSVKDKPGMIAMRVKAEIISFIRFYYNLITYPFKIIHKILHKIFSIELKLRLFSFRTLFLIILVLFINVSVIGGVLFYFVFLEDIPAPEKLAQKTPKLTTNIYDRHGNILYRSYDNEDRSYIYYHEIPENLIHATVSIEDQEFFVHKGLSIRGITRAARNTLFNDDLEGGSTITQQLIKNTLLTNERTIIRKGKEALLAIAVERTYSKEKILEMYLNTISYGGTSYGIKSASRKYFNKAPDELSLSETAFLAGLPIAPSNYSPFGSKPENGINRKNEVLRRMLEDRYISYEEYDEALNEDLVFNQNIEYMMSPHFVNYVLEELERKYGSQLVRQGGLDVYTSLDDELQNKLEEIVKTNVTEFKKYNVNNGAALITNPRTGEIYAMVGSVDYWDIGNDGNVNVTISPRQPGSSIKPITYSLAFERGYDPDKKIADSPVSYPIAGHKAYSPVNYDGRFHGTVTLRSALANSYNVPAVKLLNELGVDQFIDHAEKLGITTYTERNRYGLSITLGAGEIKMTDLATAYSTFPNLGKTKEVNPILRVYDSFGNLIDENGCVDFMNDVPKILTQKRIFETQVLAANSENTSIDNCSNRQTISPLSAYYINSILSDNKARMPAFGSRSSLNIDKVQVASKTGTTTNLKDNWAIGYTNDYLIATWIGNNDGAVMTNVVSGYRGATEIWRDAIDYIIENRNVDPKLKIPDTIIEVEICPLTNTLGCDACPNIKKVYEKGKEPKEKCTNSYVKELLKKIEDEKNKTEENEGDEND